MISKFLAYSVSLFTAPRRPIPVNDPKRELGDHLRANTQCVREKSDRVINLFAM